MDNFKERRINLDVEKTEDVKIEKTEISEETVKTEKKKNDTSKKRCKVVSKLKSNTIIDFDGTNIKIKGTYTSKDVEVEYEGKIGKKDFKIINIK